MARGRDLTDYYRVDDVAIMFGVSKMTVYRMIHNGEIECFKVGPRNFRIPKQAVEDYIERNTR